MILFTSSLIIYSFVTLLIKVAMNNFLLSPQEVLYFVSLIVLLGFYFSSRGQDILNIPPNMYSAILMRILGGFFSDIFLYIAFTYMSYSKGICIFFMNTLMIPIFARCILKEPILKIDGFGIAMGFIGMILIVQPFKESEELNATKSE